MYLTNILVLFAGVPRENIPTHIPRSTLSSSSVGVVNGHVSDTGFANTVLTFARANRDHTIIPSYTLSSAFAVSMNVGTFNVMMSIPVDMPFLRNRPPLKISRVLDEHKSSPDRTRVLVTLRAVPTQAPVGACVPTSTGIVWVGWEPWQTLPNGLVPLSTNWTEGMLTVRFQCVEERRV